MDTDTLRRYNENAADLAAGYEAADLTATHRLLLAHLPPAGPVLEIGCGSGREAAFLLARGYAVTAVDAAPAMLAAALRHHPELSGRLIPAALPFETDAPLLARRFAAVVCLAVLMHVSDAELPRCADQIRGLLVPGGVLFLSTSTGRTGLVGGRAGDGRLFYERPPDALHALFGAHGFRLIAYEASPDTLDRPLRWHNLIFTVC